MSMTIKEIQAIELALFKWFHKFCVEKQLRYYMSGGTLLGAVRHQGFIPWDDDIDVHMPRKDFNKFLAEAGKIPVFLTLGFLDHPATYPYDFGKLASTRTLVKEKYMPGHKMGIYLDIFPIDGVPEDKEVQHRLEQEELKLAKQLEYHYFIPKGIMHPKSKLEVWFKQILYGRSKGLSPKLYREKYDELLQFDFDKSLRVKNFTCYGKNEKENIPQTYYGKPTLMIFADTRFYGMEQADLYLKHFYGDYLQLPSMEKRHGHDMEATYLPGWDLAKILEEFSKYV